VIQKQSRMFRGTGSSSNGASPASITPPPTSKGMYGFGYASHATKESWIKYDKGSGSKPVKPVETVHASKESWIKYDKGSASKQNKSSDASPLKIPTVFESALKSKGAANQSKAAGSQIVGILPVADIKPKQLIPVTDKSVPLAKRHSQMIKQCKFPRYPLAVSVLLSTLSSSL
jgi:hypothetical protein